MTEIKHEVNPLEQRNRENEQIRSRMKKIKHKIAIISGKGGVGKSLVTVNLAALLAKKGKTRAHQWKLKQFPWISFYQTRIAL